MNARNTAQAPATSRHLKPRRDAKRAAQESLDARPVGRHAQAPSILVRAWHVALAMIAGWHPARGLAQLRKLAHRAQHRLPVGGRGAVAAGVSAALLVSVFIVPVVAASDAVADPVEGALVHGVLMVDADDDGQVSSGGRVAEQDQPLAGAAVTLRGVEGASGPVTTGDDGVWAFYEQDVADLTGPFTVEVSVAGVASDLYVMSTKGAAFTPAEDNPRLAVSTSFDVTESPVVLDALAVPAWGVNLILQNGDGWNGMSARTGTAPFDQVEGDGRDISASDDRVRSGDLVSFLWSLSVAAQTPTAQPVQNVTLEQTITLPQDSAGERTKANFENIPAYCEKGGSITAYPSGTALAPRTDPPAGTETVVLTCGIGPMGAAGKPAAHILGTNIWTSGNSIDGQQFSTSARAYATDAAGVALARPSWSEGRQDVEAGPFTIVAAPQFDLRQWGFVASGKALSDFDGNPDTAKEEVVFVQSTLTVATDRRVGAEAFDQPVTFEQVLWGTETTGAANPIGGLRYRIAGCGAAGGQSRGAVYGYRHQNWPDERAVSNSGTCSFARGNATDFASNYTMTLSGIDTSASQYPTQTVDGSDLSAGPFYVAAYVVTFEVPFSELTAKGGGSLNLYSRVGDFDPAGRSGASNHGEGYEPGYCQPGPATAGADDCARMDDLNPATADDERSNNVVGPTTVKTGALGEGLTWSKAMRAPEKPWVNGAYSLPEATWEHDGNAQVQPGQVYAAKLSISNTGQHTYNQVEQCDVFDNTVAKLAPLNDVSGRNMTALTDTTYSYLSANGSQADGKALTELFDVKYAHVDLRGDDPMLDGTRDNTTNRFLGDWTNQRAVTCNQVPTADWKTDPKDVPGGIDAVNIVWLTPKDPSYTLEPGKGISWWLAFEQRDTFYGVPHQGEKIPSGTVFANFGRYRVGGGDWNNPTYIPGAGTTNNKVHGSESADRQGDRWTVTRAVMALQVQTSSVELPDGDHSAGVASVGEVGAAVAGRPLVWQVDASLSAIADDPPEVRDVEITFTLPAYATYDANATAALAGGTPPSSTRNDDGTMTLVWSFSSLKPGEKIPPRLIVTTTDELTPHNTALVSAATMTAPTLVPLKHHTDDHTVKLEQTGQVRLIKEVDRTEDVQNGEQNYTLLVKNVGGFEIQQPTVIDVLPQNGDGTIGAETRDPESAYRGTSTLAEPPKAFWFDGETSAPGTFYYMTAVQPGDVPLTAAQNAGSENMWSKEFTENATAFKFVASNSLAMTDRTENPDSGLIITYKTEQSGNWPGDVYANRFTLYSNSVTAPNEALPSNQTTVRVSGLVMNEPVKSVADRGAVAVGDDVVWTVTADIPDGFEATETAGYKITDTLDEKLTYVGAAVSLSGDGAPDLEEETHYRVEEKDGTLTVEFTEDDLLTEDGLDVLAANQHRAVIVEITTTVNAVGEIANAATVFPDKSGGEWVAGYPTNEVETRWGTVDVRKTNGTESLAGAEFRVWAEFADPKGGPDTIKELVSEDTWTTSSGTGDGHGTVTIEGLRYSRFADGLALAEDGEPFEDGYIQYWLEEVKAPAGHELLAEMIPFEVDDADADIELEVTNVPANAGFDLPPLGGGAPLAWQRTGLLLVTSALVLALLMQRWTARPPRGRHLAI